jgi:hypothetical protein
MFPHLSGYVPLYQKHTPPGGFGRRALKGVFWIDNRRFENCDVGEEKKDVHHLGRNHPNARQRYYHISLNRVDLGPNKMTGIWK